MIFHGGFLNWVLAQNHAKLAYFSIETHGFEDPPV